MSLSDKQREKLELAKQKAKIFSRLVKAEKEFEMAKRKMEVKQKKLMDLTDELNGIGENKPSKTSESQNHI